MNNFLSQLNLTPQERRIVVIIFLVVIVVLNFLFVWPHFGEWNSINKDLDKMRQSIADEQRTILMDTNPTNGWRKQVDKLASKERKDGGVTLERPVDPQNQFRNTIREQERKTGVMIENYNPGSVKTNDPFFEEHSITISFNCQEAQLVSFLYNVGNDPAMIRVAKLNLQPADVNRYRLKGSMTLTANYAKKQVVAASAASPANKPAAGGKPAATPAVKPGPAVKPAAAGKPAPPTPGHPPNRAPNAPSPAGANKPLPGGLKPPGARPTPIPRPPGQ